ncbi:MAG TPA: hypothetical protein VL382_09970 [Terriglobales bacterium]|nr:hypothetical protein [Terriglobales bacterium]
MAKVMLVIYVALGVGSIVLLVRSFYKPLDATPEKAAALKKVFWVGSRFVIGGAAMGIYAVFSKQYYLLAAAALLASLGAPIVVQYLRVKSALNRSFGQRENHIDE